MTRPDAGVAGPDDLRGLRVLAIDGSTNMALAHTFAGAEVVPFSGDTDDVLGDMLGMLRGGEVDAVVDDDVCFIEPDPTLRVAFTVPTRNAWGGACRKGDRELVERLDDALERVDLRGLLGPLALRPAQPVLSALHLPRRFVRHDVPMSDDEKRDNFEETLRAMAQNFGDSFKRLVGDDLDFDDIARATGIDPDEVKRWANDAGEWLNSQSGRFQGEPAGPKPPAEDPLGQRRSAPARRPDAGAGPRARGARLGPLDDRARHEHARLPRRGAGPEERARPGARAARARLDRRRRHRDARRAARPGALARLTR